MGHWFHAKLPVHVKEVQASGSQRDHVGKSMPWNQKQENLSVVGMASARPVLQDHL